MCLCETTRSECCGIFMSPQHKQRTQLISFTAVRHISRYKTVIHAPSAASCGVTGVCGASRRLRACRGEVALIRTSPQPLCHFYSGASLGGPHFIGEAGGRDEKAFTQSCIIHNTGVDLTLGDIGTRGGETLQPPLPQKKRKKKKAAARSRWRAGILQHSEVKPARGNLRGALILFRRCSYLISVPRINISTPPTSPPPPSPKRALIRLRN